MDYVTEQDYPIKARWILKAPMIYFFSLMSLTVIMIIFMIKPEVFSDPANQQPQAPPLLIFLLYIFYILILMGGAALRAALLRYFYKYSLNENYFDLRQGIITKQERHIPYASIQHILIKRGLVDRLLGLSVLVVENASFGGGAAKGKPIGWHGAFNTQQGQQLEAIGFAGNTVQIPGLLASDAEELKQIILKKMLENRAVETGSGL